MPSAKPPRPPSFDDKTFSQRLWDRVRTDKGAQYAVFRPTNDAGAKIGFPRFADWVRNLRDIVNANALFLDDVKRDLDNSQENNGVAHASFDQRLKLLEAQINNPPFPG